MFYGGATWSVSVAGTADMGRICKWRRQIGRANAKSLTTLEVEVHWRCFDALLVNLHPEPWVTFCRRGVWVLDTPSCTKAEGKVLKVIQRRDGVKRGLSYWGWRQVLKKLDKFQQLSGRAPLN